MENTTAGEALVVEFVAKALAPVALFKAETDVRYYLNGVCVQPGPDGVGCYVVGCDGHRLAVWYDAGGKCSRQAVFSVSKELVSASRKKGAKDGREVLDGNRLTLISDIGEELFVQAGKAEIEMGTVGAGKFSRPNTYPDVFRVVPHESKLQPGMIGSYNGRYLEDIGKAAKLLEVGGKWGHGSSVWHFTGEKGGATVTRFDKAEDFILVTMPMRSDGFDRWTKLPAAVRRKHADNRDAVPAAISHPTGSMGEEVAPC